MACLIGRKLLPLLMTSLTSDRTKLVPSVTGPLLLKSRLTLTGPTRRGSLGVTLTIRLFSCPTRGEHLFTGLIITTWLWAVRNMPISLCPVVKDPLEFGMLRNRLPGPPSPPWPVTTMPRESVPSLQQMVLLLTWSLRATKGMKTVAESAATLCPTLTLPRFSGRSERKLLLRRKLSCPKA